MNIEPIVVEEARVLLRGELAEDVIFDNLDWSDSEHASAYKELFENVGLHPGDPSESYYQGMTFTRVIRRKSDGRLFGFSYWKMVSKYGEPVIETNAEEQGIKIEYDSEWMPVGGEVFVFLPVREFSITGYVVEKK